MPHARSPEPVPHGVRGSDEEERDVSFDPANRADRDDVRAHLEKEHNRRHAPCDSCAFYSSLVYIDSLKDNLIEAERIVANLSQRLIDEMKARDAETDRCVKAMRKPCTSCFGTGTDHSDLTKACGFCAARETAMREGR